MNLLHVSLHNKTQDEYIGRRTPTLSTSESDDRDIMYDKNTSNSRHVLKDALVKRYSNTSDVFNIKRAKTVELSKFSFSSASSSTHQPQRSKTGMWRSQSKTKLLLSPHTKAGKHYN